MSLTDQFKAKYGALSIQEKESQRALKPEPSRQLGLHLDATLTTQTRRRYMSTMPTTTEELRDKYAIMSNMWLLAQLRQLVTPSFRTSLLRPGTNYLRNCLSTRNFRLEREIGGVKMIVPQWSHCLEYEF